MTKRYTYFRDPTGKPYTRDDGKHAPAHLLAELGNTASVGADDKVSWTNGFAMVRYQPVLRSAAVVLGPDGEELNDEDAWGILWRALVEVVRKAPGKPVRGVRQESRWENGACLLR